MPWNFATALRQAIETQVNDIDAVAESPLFVVARKRLPVIGAKQRNGSA